MAGGRVESSKKSFDARGGSLYDGTGLAVMLRARLWTRTLPLTRNGEGKHGSTTRV